MVVDEPNVDEPIPHTFLLVQRPNVDEPIHVRLVTNVSGSLLRIIGLFHRALSQGSFGIRTRRVPDPSLMTSLSSVTSEIV